MAAATAENLSLSGRHICGGPVRHSLTSPGATKLDRLDALRGFAAVYVVLHHAVPHHLMLAGIDIGVLFRFGQEAVILFFLLSGFVINYSFRRAADQGFRVYFLKRATRIYIPLLLVMLLGWVLECLKHRGFASVRPIELLLNLLMLQDTVGLKPNVVVAPYMDNIPLWSLSYEWWFYMLYYAIRKWIPLSRDANVFVFSLAVAAAVLYLVEPVFIPRLLMYMSIWWAGVCISDNVLAGRAMALKQLALPLTALLAIGAINGYSVWLALRTGEHAGFGVHPALELRHHLFAALAILVAVGWCRFRWIGFHRLFGPFLRLAPTSYVMYISHQYLVVNASYLSFLNNRWLELLLYCVPMLAFCHGVELKLFPWLQQKIVTAACPHVPARSGQGVGLSPAAAARPGAT